MDNNYMKPEKSRGFAFLQAAGAFARGNDFKAQAQRLISDLYLYIKEETDLNFKDLVDKSIYESDSWNEYKE